MHDPAPTDDPNPAWRRLTEPDEVAAALIDLVRRRGSAHYEEAIDQTTHARQAGALAMADGASDQLVVAAFLHDIGHFLLDDAERQARLAEVDLHHEDVGSRFLANWFPPTVTEPIRLHVAAKRFLCAETPAYLASLSPASVASLGMQGGPMTPDEVASFRDELRHRDACALRIWDDRAKVPDAITPTLDAFEQLIVSVLAT